MTPHITRRPFMLALSLLVWSTMLLAQEVSFYQETSLLESTGGFGINDCAVDMNGDYLDDVVRVANNGLNIDFQQTDGSFTHQFFPVDFDNSPSWSICAGDLDGNGLNDLLFGGGNAVSFVMAAPDGSYYTEDRKPDYIFSQRSTMFDIDNDGHLDAFVCHDVDLSHPYRNDGTGYLEEDQSLIETINLPGNYAAIWVDYDNDNDGDLYLTKCRGSAQPGDPSRTNALYRNNGDGTFTEVGEEAGVADNAQSWATVFEDFDNDGDFDAFIVNHDFQNRFYLNNGDGTFTDIIDDTGIAPGDLGAWENAAADFNNDGFVDIFSELNNSLYINNGDLTFTPSSLPVNDGGIGDFNDDGFLDVVKGNTLWMNSGNDNNWVKINTRGIISNRNGIGARIEIYGDWGMQIREVRSGQSFSPMSSLCAHFGLGPAETIDQIIVRWPSGIVTVLDNPDINTAHTVVEAECLLAPAAIEYEGDQLLCPDETIALTAPEGFDTYLWSTGDTLANITVTTAGSYSLAAFNDDGCVSISENVVFMEAEETAPIVVAQGDLAFCVGESVTLVAEGGDGYTWSTGEAAASIEVSDAGEYFVGINSICSDEQLVSESVVVTNLMAPAPVPDAPMLDGDMAFLAATGDNIQWFAEASGGEPIETGPNFITPPLMEGSNFYYVESHHVYGGELQEGGKPNIDGAGGLSAVGGYNFFDAYDEFTILTVDVVVPENSTEGTRTIQLFDAENNLMDELIVDLAFGEHTIDLNFVVPEGEGYTLRCVEDDLYRNNFGVEYPYPIGDVGEIITSFYGDSYYYYFYNWQIQKKRITCISERVAVEIVFVDAEDLPDVSGVQVFPNPASDRVAVQFELDAQQPLGIELQDVLGQTIMERYIERANIGENRHELDVSQLPAGIYQLILRVDGKAATWKVVVE